MREKKQWTGQRLVRCLAGLLLLLPALVFGQAKTITGKITDENGKPMVGVSVVASSGLGTKTDGTGRFTLSVATGSTLTLSHIGYQNGKIVIGDKTDYSLTLRLSSATSDEGNEVVVVGYNTVKRKDLTGSVASAPMREMLKAPTPNIADALEGRVAGVVVSSPDGQPGSMPNIVIRGNTSITGDNTPLYVIDGFPIEGANIPAFNPNDIESMDILKDASATAIYGARGSNGVIVITTKKGKSGAPTVSIGLTGGIQEVTKDIPLLSAYDYVSYYHERDSLSNNYASLTFTDPNTGTRTNVQQNYYATDQSYGLIGYYNPTTGLNDLLPPGSYNNGKTIVYPFGDPRNLDKYKSVAPFDLQKAMRRAAAYQSYDLSLSGGNDKTRYYMSGNLTNQNGVMINTGFKRYVGRISLDQTINDKLKMGVNVSYANIGTWGGSPTPANSPTGAYSSANAPFYTIYGYRPTSPLDSLGNQTSNLVDAFIDPVLRTTNNATTAPIINPVLNQNHKVQNVGINNLNASGYIEFKITPSLVLRSSGSIITNSSTSKNFFDTLTQKGSSASNGGTPNPQGSFFQAQTTTWTNSNQLTYTKTFAQKHHFAILGVVEEQGNYASNFGFTVTNITNPSLGINALDNGSAGATTATVSTNNTLASFASQVNYNYNGKYYLTGSFRADGSSKFAPGNKWGYFPSGAFKWKFSQEDFLRNSKILSDGNVRVSYGQAGNNRGLSNDFPYLSQIVVSGTTGQGAYSANGTSQAGFYPGSLANAGLKWETLTQTDIGTDLSFLNNRITFTADVYRKVSKNLLLNATIPYSLGYTSVNANIGSMQNQGLELTIGTTNIQTKNFLWSSTFNISWNSNKILSLTQGQDVYQSPIGWDNNYGNTTAYVSRIGQPLGQMYGLVADGVYQTSDFNYTTALNTSASNVGKGSHWVLKDNVPTNGNPRLNIQPGDIKYKDLNGDGVASLGSGDYTVIGRGLPIHTGGFGNNFRYKGLDLNVFFQWNYGNNIENAGRYIFEGNINNAPGVEQFATEKNRWTPTNTNTNIPRIFGAGPVGQYSSRVIEDGSYLRLKTVNIGYNLSPSTLRRLGIKTFRIYLSGQNLVTWTKYTGQDPEISVFNSPLTPGFDWSGYSRGRTFAMGINLSF